MLPLSELAELWMNLWCIFINPSATKLVILKFKRASKTHINILTTRGYPKLPSSIKGVGHWIDQNNLKQNPTVQCTWSELIHVFATQCACNCLLGSSLVAVLWQDSIGFRDKLEYNQQGPNFPRRIHNATSPVKLSYNQKKNWILAETESEKLKLTWKRTKEIRLSLTSGTGSHKC